MKYSSTELMASVASKLLEDKKSVFVGTGLPMIAAMLAQRTIAPSLLIIFQAGGIGPRVPVLPISVGDSRTFFKAVAASSMHDVMSMACAGHCDYSFLGAAMIDEYGNINTTVIGEWEHPVVRLPGSGGANDIGAFSRRTIVMMRQEKTRFVKKVDFITTPGYMNGPGDRERAGLPADGGPYRVITQLGAYGFDEETKRIRLVSLHPGVTTGQIKESSSMDIIMPEAIETSPLPTEREIEILREIDPMGIIIKH